MREGLAAGVTIPRVIVERSLQQMESLAPEDIAKSALWKPIAQFPVSIEREARDRLEADYRQLLTEHIFPAVRRVATFVRQDYLPRARMSDGFSALPQGRQMYRLAVRSETTTDMTPDQIHELGLAEVKRIQGRLLAAGEKGGFKGPMSDLRRWLRANPENYPFDSSDQVIDYLNRIHARIVLQLPRLFGRFPKAKFEIRLTEPELAGSAPAQWHSPSDDGTRPGVFSIPVVDARRIDLRVGILARARGYARTSFRRRYQARKQCPAVSAPIGGQCLRRRVGPLCRIPRP
jgi:uncharacterized protein (DUF885 family)